MNLQEKLDAKKQELQSALPGEAFEVMHRATEALKSSGIIGQAKKAGDTAPDFTLADSRGRTVSLFQKLDQGPVVLGFYRGGW